MPDYDVMKQILGKTIKGVIVKENTERFSQPAMAVHLFFTDGTSYEIYSSMLGMDFASGLNRWSMNEAGKYLSPPWKMFSIFLLMISDMLAALERLSTFSRILRKDVTA